MSKSPVLHNPKPDPKLNSKPLPNCHSQANAEFTLNLTLNLIFDLTLYDRLYLTLDITQNLTVKMILNGSFSHRIRICFSWDGKPHKKATPVGFVNGRKLAAIN